MLDVWLSNSAPFRKVIEKAMTQALANLNMPSRDDVTRLAERLTNIEMRLDDLDAKLDQVLQRRAAVGAPSKLNQTAGDSFMTATQTPETRPIIARLSPTSTPS